MAKKVEAIELKSNARVLPKKYRKTNVKAAERKWQPAGDCLLFDAWGLAIRALKEQGIEVK